MTKKYDIIHLPDGFMYGIDKEDSGKSNDTIIDIVGRLWINMEECFHKVALNQGCWKVQFTNNPSLGLPLLPDMQENLLPLIDYAWNMQDMKSDLSAHSFLVGFEEGYKAASAKKYTEEDIKSAIRISFGQAKQSKLNIGEVESRIIQSLSPKPIAVEVEMEERDPKEMSHNSSISGLKLKLNDNQVIVKQWIHARKTI